MTAHLITNIVTAQNVLLRRALHLSIMLSSALC